MTIQQDVQRLYIAYFGRPADPVGLQYWTNQLSTNKETIQSIANNFALSPEYSSNFTGLTASQIVTAIYQNLFGRQPDTAGLFYWAEELTAGTQSIGKIALTIATAARDDATAGTFDATTLTAKIQASENFTDAVADSVDKINGYSGSTANALARAYVASVIDAATLTSATAGLDATVAAVVAAGGPPGQSFVLTTATDTVAGTVGNDIITGTQLTLTAFDNISGGAGNDTFNITTTAAGTDLDTTGLALTVSGVETVNVSATGEVSINSSTWAGVNALNVLASTGSDTVEAAATTAVRVVNSSGDVKVTGGSSVDVTTTDGEVTVNGVAGTSSVTVKSDDKVTISDANAGSTTKASTITTVSIDGAGDDVVINTSALSSLSLANTDQKVTVNDGLTTKTATTLSLTIDSLASGAELDDAAVKTLNVTTAGDASEIKFTTKAATTINILGTEDLTLSSGGDYTKLATLTVGGAVGLTGDLSGAGALKTITSTATADQDLTIAATATAVTLGAGADTVTQAAALGATQAINTGTGDDTVILGGALTAGARIDGGAGTDALSLTSAVATGATNGVQELVFSNFEVIAISDALGAALNLDNLDSIQNLVLEAGSGAFTVSGLASGATVTYADANSATSTLAVTNALIGTADSINLVFSNTVGTDFLDVLAADVETVSIVSTDTSTTNDPGDIAHTVGLSASVETLNVSGDAGLIIDTALTNVATINAASFDAGLTVDLTGNTTDATITTGAGADDITVADSDNTISAGDGDNVITAGNGDNSITVGDGDSAISAGDGDNVIVGGESAGAGQVTVGDGSNTITLGDGNWNVTVGTGANTIVLGAGDDIVTVGAAAGLNVVTFGAGDDVLVFNGVQIAAGYYTSITDIAAGDQIDFSGIVAHSISAMTAGARITLGGASSFANYLDAAAAGDGETTNDIVHWFQFNGNTYIVLDSSSETTFQDGQDTVVELVGLVSLTNSEITGDVLTIG